MKVNGTIIRVLLFRRLIVFTKIYDLEQRRLNLLPVKHDFKVEKSASRC